MATYWRESQMPFDEFPNIGIDGLMRVPAWADPWPIDVSAAT
jgi:glutathione S-transferase